MRKIVFILLVLSFRPNAMAYATTGDSAVWPLMDSIKLNISIKGGFWSKRVQVDPRTGQRGPNNWDTSVVSMVSYPGVVLSRADTSSHYSYHNQTMHFIWDHSGPQFRVDSLSITITLDTLHRKISSLEYIRVNDISPDYFEQEELVLRDLEYSDSSIAAQDEEIANHVVYAYSSVHTGAHDWDYSIFDLGYYTDVTLTGTISNHFRGLLNISPAFSQAFDTSVGDVQSKEIFLKDTTSSEEIIPSYGLSFGAPFQLSDTMVHVLQPGDSIAVRVAFRPMHRGVVFDTLHFLNHALTLEGRGREGVLATQSQTVDIGEVPVDSVLTATVWVSNSGDGPLTLDSVRATRTDSTFRIAAGHEVPLTADRSNITITFSPKRAGLDTADLDVHYVTSGGASDSLIRLIAHALPSANVFLSPVSVQAIEVYPNPALNQVYIAGKSDDILVFVSLTDAAGHVLKKYETGGLRNAVLNVHNLPAGAYFLQAHEKSGRVILQPLVIEH